MNFGDLQRSVPLLILVTFIKKGPTKWEFMIFGSKLKDLQFDVNEWKWNCKITKL
jgi:hypothetical protein